MEREPELQAQIIELAREYFTLRNLAQVAGRNAPDLPFINAALAGEAFKSARTINAEIWEQVQ